VQQLFWGWRGRARAFSSTWDYCGKCRGIPTASISARRHTTGSIFFCSTFSPPHGNSQFSEVAASWNPERLSPADRLEIYGNFLWTKNASRWRYRTWRNEKESARGVALVPVTSEEQA